LTTFLTVTNVTVMCMIHDT